MDYGQPVVSDNKSDFFTSGAGTNQDNLNNFEAENNFDLSNGQTNWDISQERDNRNIGNIAINAPEVPKSIEERVMPDNTGAIEMREIVDMGPLPGESTGSNVAGDAANTSENFNRNAIKTGERLDDGGVDEVQKVINKLNHDGNVTDFYDNARDMMEANLDNSYHRKLES